MPDYYPPLSINMKDEIVFFLFFFVAAWKLGIFVKTSFCYTNNNKSSLDLHNSQIIQSSHDVGMLELFRRLELILLA